MAILEDLTSLKDSLFPGTDWKDLLTGGTGVATLLAALTGQPQDQIAKTIQEQAQSSATSSQTSGTSDVTSMGQTAQNQTGTTTQATSGSTTGTSAQQQTGTTQQATTGTTAGTSAQQQTGTTQESGVTTQTVGGPAWWEAKQKELADDAARLPGYKAYFTGKTPVVGAFSALEGEAVGRGREAGKSVLDMGIERYMNPYLENVLDPMMRRLGEDQALEQQQLAAQRVSRGAFGSGRADILANQQRERQTLEEQDVLAKGYQQAFNSATGLAEGDAERMRQAASFLASMGGTQRGIEDTRINRLYDEYQKLQNDPRELAKLEAGIVGGLKPAQTTAGTTSTLGTTAQNTLGSTTGTSAQNTLGSTATNTTGQTTGTTQQATTGTTDMNTTGTTLNQSLGTTTGQQSGTSTGTTAGTVTGVQSGTDLTDAQKLAAGMAGLTTALYPTQPVRTP